MISLAHYLKQNGKVYIIVVSCYFIKWTEVYALRDHTAQSVPDVMVNEFISRFGVPRPIHTALSLNFESGLFTELCKLLGVVKTWTTPYRPQSNRQVEHFNQTLQQMLTLVSESQDDWDDLLPYVAPFMTVQAAPLT